MKMKTDERFEKVHTDCYDSEIIRLETIIKSLKRRIVSNPATELGLLCFELEAKLLALKNPSTKKHKPYGYKHYDNVIDGEDV